MLSHVFVRSSRTSAPTLVVLHGMGGNEYDLLDFAKDIAPNAHLLGIRGNVLEKGLSRFYASGFDPEDIATQVDALQTCIREAAAVYSFDVKNVSALGWSNGANMASLLLLHAPQCLQSALLFRPLFPPVPKPLPNLASIRVFVSGGLRDSTDPPAETEKLVHLLEHAQASVTCHWQDVGHALEESEKPAAHTWWNVAH